MKTILWMASFAMLLATANAAAVQPRRVALVIGNGAYTAVAKLDNPSADAGLVADSLRKAGFTTVNVRRDLGKISLEKALRDFGKQADGAELALIYYAGHGIEVGGQNYLIPTDARLERDRDVDIEATRLDTLLTYSEGAKLRVVILDACRNNPFVNQLQRSVKSRSIGRGLAAVEPMGETLVVYAAKAGATASDGDGDNSPFAQALARRLPEPGVEINMVFRRVRDDVLARTGRSQEPFSYGSLSGNEFYFVRGKPAAATPAADTSVETEYWRSATAANTEGAYRAYLKRYPGGEYAELANENLRRFAPQAAAKPAAKPVAVVNTAAPKPGGKETRVTNTTQRAPVTATAPQQKRPIEKGLSKGIGVSIGAFSQVVSAIKTVPGSVRNRGENKPAAPDPQAQHAEQRVATK